MEKQLQELQECNQSLLRANTEFTKQLEEFQGENNMLKKKLAGKKLLHE